MNAGCDRVPEPAYPLLLMFRKSRSSCDTMDWSSGFPLWLWLSYPGAEADGPKNCSSDPVLCQRREIAISQLCHRASHSS